MKNHLTTSKNPYLRMHMHQPIHWHIWEKETFEKAEKENKPIFLSIGYSTCHWCHVMAKESFEDKEIAEKLNASFISIKVDREEYPEIDAVYMNFCQALTGSGGWPLTVFMTPKQIPFFAGTYFPKHSRNGRIGFSDLLDLISRKWQTERNKLIHEAEFILEEVSELLDHHSSSKDNGDLTKIGLNYLIREFDHENGGFGSAPKFPAPHKILFLLECYESHGDKQALNMAEYTATQMAKGGIFDHIDGGFCRYSTYSYFLIPHFEKMLYDNALLIYVYAKLYEVTKRKLYLSVAERIASFLCNEMRSQHGGFYTARDADSDDEEGKYYSFTLQEVLDLLGEEKGTPFCFHYHLTKTGNFEGKNIPNLLNTEITETDFSSDDPIKSQLSAYRKERNELFTDEKVLTAGNAMVIAAFVLLYRASEKKCYLDIAVDIEKMISQRIYNNGILTKGLYEDGSMGQGTLEDYGWYIYALLHLYSVTFSEKYIDFAGKLLNDTLTHFYDPKNGGFFTQSKDMSSLILSLKESFDGAVPSGNSVMAENLRLLSLLTEDQSLEMITEQQMKFMKKIVNESPQNAFFFLITLNRFGNDVPKKIICAYTKSPDMDYILSKTSSRDLLIPKMSDADFPVIHGQNTYYKCDNKGCGLPSNSIDQ